MTPAEAREIDRLEFEAECVAIRQRAYALVRQARAAARQPNAHIDIDVTAAADMPLDDAPIGQPRPRNLRLWDPFAARYYTALGKRLTLKEWSAATGFSAHTIRSRLSYGWPVERAVTEPLKCRPRKRHRGVVSNFPTFAGTGAGSTAQETPEITFSEEANS